MLLGYLLYGVVLVSAMRQHRLATGTHASTPPEPPCQLSRYRRAPGCAPYGTSLLAGCFTLAWQRVRLPVEVRQEVWVQSLGWEDPLG